MAIAAMTHSTGPGVAACEDADDPDEHILLSGLWKSKSGSRVHLGEAGPCAAELAAGAEHDDVQVRAGQRQARRLAAEQRRAAARPHGARRGLDAPHGFCQQVNLRLWGSARGYTSAMAIEECVHPWIAMQAQDLTRADV